jgi:hypothetical protein
MEKADDSGYKIKYPIHSVQQEERINKGRILYNILN